MSHEVACNDEARGMSHVNLRALYDDTHWPPWNAPLGYNQTCGIGNVKWHVLMSHNVLNVWPFAEALAPSLLTTQSRLQSHCCRPAGPFRLLRPRL